VVRGILVVGLVAGLGAGAIAYAHDDRPPTQGQIAFAQQTSESNFRDACSLCHTNFGPTDPTLWVGALMLRVPIGR
jgi:hypothetical protein